MKPAPARDYLAWAALAAALVVSASAEYQLARAAGFGELVAGALPAALDIYAVRALRARRDVAAAVVAMIATNAASHLVAAGLLPVDWPLVVAVSAIAPLVLWRVHRLAEYAEQPVPERVPERPVKAVKRPRVRPRPVPEAVPAGVRLLPIVARPQAAEYAPEQREQAEQPVPEAVPAEAPRRRRVTVAAPEKRPAVDVAELIERARTEYAGRTPSIRELRAAYRIGQAKATAVRDALATAN